MEIEFILPDIGEGIVECELLEWLVAEGDVIEEDQPVAEVMTDKATVQIPAMHGGTINALHYKVGDIAKVHAPLFSLTTANDEIKHVSESNDSDDSNSNESKPAETKASHVHTEDFILPDIGEGIVECEIVKWNVKEGDVIAEDQSVVEVMTDKAVVEIPAKNAGTVHKLYYGQGDIAKVHSPLFAISISGDTCSVDCTINTASDAPSSVQKKAGNQLENSWLDGEFDPPVAIPGKVIASPAVRRIARENNINLLAVEGSGKKGRILKRDVANTSVTDASVTGTQEQHAACAAKPTRSVLPVEDKPAIDDGTANRTVKVRGVQAAMAKHMMNSVSTIPHFMVSDEVVMDNLMALRSKLKPEFERKGVKLSFMPFFIKALSLALDEYPIINSQLNDDGTELTYLKSHNIGFAVDAKVGLLVPNIKNVASLSLFEVAQQMHTIIEQARDGNIAGEALKGGTVTISNIGAIGGITATPVINKPESAIVALGKTQKLPRFDEKGEVTAQHIMRVNWSGDHRTIDGATMVRFNNVWCQYLMSPETMLMHLK